MTPGQARVVHRGEGEQEDAETERADHERPERRPLERRRRDRAGERAEAERRREEAERARVDVQRVRREERHEGVEVEADEPDAGDDDEDGAHLGVAPGERQPLACSREDGDGAIARHRVELVLAHREQGGEDGEEAERVDEEADADAGGCDQHAGDRGADRRERR